MDGRVAIEGCELDVHSLTPQQLFPRVLQNQEFDVSELSISSYMLQLARGQSAYTAIPVFPSRFFRHGGIFVRSDAGIETPKELEGKRIGIPEYQMTAMVWMRGFLQDEYGVDFRNNSYLTGSVNATGLKERLPLDLPPSMDVKPAPPDRSLNDLLLAGELDAIYAAAAPKAFQDGDRRIRTLFADPVAAEKAYFKKTGFFPIMHIVAIRTSLVEANPWLPAHVFKAFVEAKKIALARMDDIAGGTANRSSLPWFRPELEATKALMGNDIWAYGLRENAAELETFCRYSHEQFLSARRLTVDEMFEASTHHLPGW